MSLQKKFRSWWKGEAKIIRIQQGDDNLIVVIFYDNEMKYYNVGEYVYRKSPSLNQYVFYVVELEKRLTKKEATDKFNRIVKSF